MYRSGFNNDESSEDRNTFAIAGGLIGIIIVILALFATIYLTRRGVIFRSKATGGLSSQSVSLENSYIFASPLKAKAGSGEKIRITVFILDGQGRGVFGKPVNLVGDLPFSIDSPQPTTDDLGTAIFDIESSSVGYFVIQATVDGKIIPQKIGVSFE